MGIFKQQERNQQRKKAKQEALDARKMATDAAAEAKEAALQEAEERASRREAAMELAVAKSGGNLKVKTVGSSKKIAGVKRVSEAMVEKRTVTVPANLKKKKTEDKAAAVIGPFVKKPSAPRHKSKVLLVSSRGINFRHRHLMNDLEALLPHSKKDAKLDSKSNLKMINELAEMSNCNSCLFFEARRREDMYLWLARTPNGPSIKFHMQNVHTMDELKMTGNCLKGTRHILSFDKSFDSEPHYQLMKEMFTQVFAVPRTSRRVKPFVDHIFSFTIADGRVWFRNYQIIENPPTAEKDKDGNVEDVALVEVGPRFVLNPIRIFGGSFGGPTVYENPTFISPSRARAMTRQLRATKYKARTASEAERKEKVAECALDADPLDEVFAYCVQ